MTSLAAGRKILAEGLKPGKSWGGTTPGVYFTASLSDAQKYAQFPIGRHKQWRYAVVEFEAPKGAKRDYFDREHNPDTLGHIRVWKSTDPIPSTAVRAVHLFSYNIKTGQWDQPKVIRPKKSEPLPAGFTLVMLDGPDVEEEQKAWEEANHPRHPAGSEQGGEFAPAQGEPSLGHLMNIFSPDDDEEEETQPAPTHASADVKALAPQLAELAQAEYNKWDPEDVDTYAGGGICHLIADEIAGALNNAGIDAQTVSSDYEQHVYTVARLSDGVYLVDVPYQVYERGAGFSWQKLPDVQIGAGDVVVHRLDTDPDRFDQYVDKAAMNAYVLKTWDESQHPRHPAGSSEGGEFAPVGEAVPPPTLEETLAERKQRWAGSAGADRRQQLAVEIQRRFGLLDDSVSVNYGDGPERRVGDTNFFEGGHFDPKTGDVVLWADSHSQQELQVMAAHEAQHARFDVVMRAYDDEVEELGKLWNQQQDAWKEAKTYRGWETGRLPDDLQVDGATRERVNLALTRGRFWPYTDSSAADLVPEVDAQFKLHQELFKLMNIGDLQKTGTRISAYAADWWDAARAGKAGVQSAVNESLAEIAAQRWAKTKPAWEVTDNWNQLYDGVQRHYLNISTTRGINFGRPLPPKPKSGATT